jgi:hypothetical protein
MYCPRGSGKYLPNNGTCALLEASNLGGMSDAVLVQIEIALGGGAELGELDEETVGLREELLELNVDAVDRPRDGPAPEGARGPEMVLAGTLLVALGKEAIGPLIRSIESWVERRRSRTVKLTLGDDFIELSQVSEAEQRRLLDAFLARHTGASG